MFDKYYNPAISESHWRTSLDNNSVYTVSYINDFFRSFRLPSHSISSLNDYLINEFNRYRTEIKDNLINNQNWYEINLNNNEKQFQICDNYNKNIERKESNYMSLIVLLKNEKGIVAASDSKATTTNMGILEEDKKRGQIQKVFKSDDFIFSICGQNKILINNETVYIEDFINHILNTKEYIKNNNLKFIEFINYLFGAIGNKNELINSPIIILCGYKINNKYEVCEIELTNNINKFSYVGDVCFMRRGYINLTPKDFFMPNGLEINQMEDFAKEYINTIIKLGNLVLPYNPIGGEIQIKNLI